MSDEPPGVSGLADGTGGMWYERPMSEPGSPRTGPHTGLIRSSTPRCDTSSPTGAGFSIRSLTPADLPAALGLWQRTEHVAPIPPAEVESLLAHDGELLLAATDAQGALCGVLIGAFDGRRGWLSRLAVEPACRRQAVAGALVAEAERRLLARGCTQVNLLIFGGNEVGRRFWTASGYTLNDDIVLGSRRLDGDGPSGC